MRQVINGKMYNTDTAEFIAHNCQGGGVSDFRYYEEDLYRKKTGEFFCAGEGGPLSPYAEACPTGGWYDGSGIRPLTIEETKAWMEEYGDIDTYIYCFGEPEE